MMTVDLDHALLGLQPVTVVGVDVWHGSAI